MAKSWILDGKTIARSVKTAGLTSLNDQIKDCEGASLECPQCGFINVNNNVSSDLWPGFPVGVKFDPSDVELLEHLAAKCGVGNKKPHPYLDEFITSLDSEEGICYQHPENLPGSRKDGISVHFFYRTTNAYNKGRRKRRKIHNGSSLTRWHKTGITKAIFKNGVQLGLKKIMVLYENGVGCSKPNKTNWVMHEYHLGTELDDKDEEYVVSKVFYHAQKQNHDASLRLTGPKTPMIDAPDPPRPGNSHPYEDATDEYVLGSPSQESECAKDDTKETTCKDDQTFDLDVSHNSFLGEDNLSAYSPSNDHPLFGYSLCTNDVVGAARAMSLENPDLGSPLDFNLSELYFPSEDSVCDGLNWL